MEYEHFKSWISEQKLDNAPAPTICKYCNGNGYLSAKLKDSEILYTALFKCFCAVGVANTKNWPVWGKRYDSKYERIK